MQRSDVVPTSIMTPPNPTPPGSSGQAGQTQTQPTNLCPGVNGQPNVPLAGTHPTSSRIMMFRYEDDFGIWNLTPKASIFGGMCPLAGLIPTDRSRTRPCTFFGEMFASWVLQQSSDAWAQHWQRALLFQDEEGTWEFTPFPGICPNAKPIPSNARWRYSGRGFACWVLRPNTNSGA